MENKTVDVIIPAYHPGKEFATLIKKTGKTVCSDPQDHCNEYRGIHVE